MIITFTWILSIDFWRRFHVIVQCLRRLCEEGDAVHGFNGLKYFLTIVAVLVRTACELKKGHAWLVLAFISSAVATMMNTYWDIVVDWGLLRRHSRNFYLRDKLLISHKSVYFAAMVHDYFLRQNLFVLSLFTFLLSWYFFFPSGCHCRF